MLLQDLLKNDKLVKALIFNEPDFLNKSIPADFDPTSLIYDKVWPFKFIPDIQDTPKSLITTLWSFKPYKSLIYFNEVIFYTIVHKDLLSIDSGLRTDFMIAQIHRTVMNCNLFKSGGHIFLEGGDTLVDSSGKWIGMFVRYGSLKLAGR